jgi:hypothetical protein
MVEHLGRDIYEQVDFKIKKTNSSRALTIGGSNAGKFLKNP